MLKPFRLKAQTKLDKQAGGSPSCLVVWCLGDVVVDVHALPAGFGPSEKIVCGFFLSITLGTLSKSAFLLAQLLGPAHAAAAGNADGPVGI